MKSLDNNIDDINNNEKIVINILKSHSDLFYESFFNYDINSYSYYRFFYVIYVLIKYVYYDLSKNMSKSDIHDIFKIVVRYTRKYRLNSDDLNKVNLVKILTDRLEENFDHLYETFFIDQNIYYSTYFNNLTKYTLPLPFEINMYSPIVTYRLSDSEKIYKKNWIDYYDNISKVDLERPYRMIEIGIRNKNIIKREFDTKVNIKYFNSKIFDEKRYNDKVFIIKTSKKLYICKNITCINGKYKIETLYSRDNDFKSFSNLESFEYLNPKWEVSIETIKVDVIFYISVLRKIKNDDLLKVFKSMSFEKEFFKEFYHYTGLEIKSKKFFEEFLKCPTFFSPTPIYYTKKAVYYRGKKCLFYDVISDINNLLDLTDNITINNPFIDPKNKFKNQETKFFAFNKVDKFFEGKDIPIESDKRYKCLEIDNEKDLNKVFEEKKYCDINNSHYYVGRRKLQEIIYKTRKYMSRDIWEEMHENIKRANKSKRGYENKINKSNRSNRNNRSNRKKNRKDNRRKIRREIKKIDIYHPNDIDPCIIYPYNYDALILKYLNVTGYFFTDYIDRIFTGGEILLSFPDKHLVLKSYSDEKCHNPNLVKKDFEK
jgi:hypothetical protein